MLININNKKSKRLKELKELKSFGSESEKSINDILSELEWSSSNLIKCEAMVLCPLNSNHRMPEKSLNKHLSKCELRSKGYNNEEIEEIESSNNAFYYEKSPHIRPVVIDKQIEEKILGIKKDVALSNDRTGIELSAQQRLALYDYVMVTNKDNSRKRSASERDDQSLKVDLFDAFNRNETQSINSKETSNKLEMLAMNRDMKRRRQSYRAKNVHIRGKSYSEILRNVIENHCQSLNSRLATQTAQNLTNSQSHKHRRHKHKSKHKSKHKHKSKDRQKKEKHRKH